MQCNTLKIKPKQFFKIKSIDKTHIWQPTFQKRQIHKEKKSGQRTRIVSASAYLVLTLSAPNSVLSILHAAAAAAKSLQLCPTLCDPIEGSPPLGFWDSAGKSNGVGYHFLLQCMKVKSKNEVAQSF